MPGAIAYTLGFNPPQESCLKQVLSMEISDIGSPIIKGYSRVVILDPEIQKYYIYLMQDQCAVLLMRVLETIAKGPNARCVILDFSHWAS